ncbi:hypothetical protein FHS85_000078 [Rhodoligotrophos appendicifer]|uniref:YciI family protein n=1 Tax=Rhodoligotrophos appendicifer TaxID=987056 RepID=UPI00117EF89A|nr:YciI family protein [Rhodoligotrophos appendicifer]
MPLFTVINRDKPNSGEIRASNRPVHIEYLKSLGERLRIAGPFIDDAGNGIGSLLIIEADTIEQAKADAAGDPFAKAGLFQSVEVQPWRWVFTDGKLV